MKKFFATVLAVIYLSTSVGATVHLHYCMGKLLSWSFTDKDNNKCGQCGMSKSCKGRTCMAVKDGCCKYRHTLVQLDKDQKTSEGTYTFLTHSFIAVPVTRATFPDPYTSSYIAGYPTTNAPPELDKVPVFIRNCTFRI